jgi:7-carboxy-7-deazaguanine synthase
MAPATLQTQGIDPAHAEPADRGLSLRISEIFHSIQGEADAVGWPTVFVRLTGCPLRCSWCDTTYSFQGGDKRTLDDVLRDVAAYQTRHVCVTGGEPLAQRNCLPLLTALCDAGHDVSLETSGALDLAAVDPRVRKVVDLKCPGSGESSRNRFENLAHLTPRDQLKLVIADRADYEWAREQCAARGLPAICTVLFSPVADTLPAATLVEWILADRLPVRFQLQLHKVLWGNVAGK